MPIFLPTSSPIVDKIGKTTDAMYAWMRDITTLLSPATGGIVTNVTATAPIASSGGTTPNISHNASGVAAATYGDSTHVPQIAVNATGHITSASNVAISAGTVTTTGSPASGNLTKFSGATSITNGDLLGDVSTSGTLVTTLANTAVTPGTYGDATHVGQFTVDSKGRLTFAQNVAISGGGGGGSWIPLVTGAEPPVFVTDGSGVLILVAGP